MTSQAREPFGNRGAFAATLLAIACGAAVLRVVFAIETAASCAWWLNFSQGLDTLTHLQTAERVLNDPWLSDSPSVFYQSPLYPYVLALPLAVFHGARTAAVALQIALSTLTVVVTGLLGRRLASPAAGLLAALLLALYAPSVAYVPFFLPATLETFVSAVLLYSTVLANGSGRPGPWLVAGAVSGLALLARPNLVVALVAALIADRVVSRRGRPDLRLVLVALLGFLAVVALPVGRNLTVANRVGLLPGSGEANFTIGNSEGSPVVGFGYPSGPPLPVLSAKFALHFLEKLAVFFWGYEVPQNLSFDLIRGQSAVLVLPLVTFPLLLGPAVAAAFDSRARVRASVVFLWTWLAAYAASIALFFVVGRFRLPAVPAFAVLAAAGVTAMVTAWTGGRRRLAAAALTAVVVTAASAVRPELPVRFNDYLILMSAASAQIPPAALIPMADQAARDYPDLPPIASARAMVLATAFDRRATTELDRAILLDPDNRSLLETALTYFRATRDVSRVMATGNRLRELDRSPSPSR